MPHACGHMLPDDWCAQVMTLPDESAELRSIGLMLPLDGIYEGVFF